MLFLTIPTAGSRPNLLATLINQCGVPRERTVIVATRPGIDLPDGTIVVEDFGTPNIQRWWNLGIEEARLRGATSIAVVNDDVSVTPSTFPALEKELMETGAAIASPSRPEFRNGLHRRRLIPYEPRLWGSLWVLRINSGLRPDPRYVWWYGDHDLDIRARRDHGGVVLVPVEYEHLHPGEGTAASEELQAQTLIDARTFETQYARLLRISRILNRVRRPFAPQVGNLNADT